MRICLKVPTTFTPALLVSVLLLAGCSSSSSSSDDGLGDSVLNDTAPSNTDVVDDDNEGATGAINDDAGNNTNDSEDESDVVVNDPANGNDGADPLIQNTTRVTFDIEVPAFQSDALQVRLTWGDRDLTAAWVGDEFWSIADDFPTNTSERLSVFFNDDNGAITLASFDVDFQTGSNASESFQISVDQFDSARWDDDNDGVSNLDESIAGTDPLGVPERKKILLFTETQGFHHDSIGTAVQTMQALTFEAGYDNALVNSSDFFTAEKLARYDAVVWVLTSGDVLNDTEQGAFEDYIRAGGGYMGIHAASDTEYNWPWYGDLVGAYFQRHPQIQSATMIVEDGSHVSTEHLGATWSRTDEWYDFRTNPRARVNVLLRLDESTYMGGGMGDDHPIAWYHNFDGGRAWYTGGGHTVDSYYEPDFRAHLAGGLRYAVGDE